MKTIKALPKRRKIGHTLAQKLKKHWILYLMALPALLQMVLFKYIPMFGLVMAFQNLDFRKGIFTSPFVGFKNFQFLFKTSDAWLITRNTVCYNLVFIVLGLFASVALALAINELHSKKLSKIIQTIFIMPFFLSAVVISMVVLGFLDYNSGFVNAILKINGMEPRFWYNDKKLWVFLIVFIRLWKETGYSSVIYTAVIAGIPNDLYEAAALDGATRWQQIKHITLPHLRTIISINLIRQCGGIFRGDFGLFYTVPMDSGALYPVTNVLDTYIYRALMNMNNINMSTAAGLYQSVVGFILVLVANRIAKKLDEQSALF